MAAKAEANASGISDDSVLAKTGRRRDDWFVLLDKAGAKDMKHPEIVAVLAEQGVGAWWRQMVTVEYERARGLREKHQAAGGYQMSATKTVAAPLGALYEAFADGRRRARWLPKSGLTQRAATPQKRIRYVAADGRAAVEALFTAKGADKSAVTVTLTKLADRAAVVQHKAYWKEALKRLKLHLEG